MNIEMTIVCIASTILFPMLIVPGCLHKETKRKVRKSVVILPRRRSVAKSKAKSPKMSKSPDSNEKISTATPTPVSQSPGEYPKSRSARSSSTKSFAVSDTQDRSTDTALGSTIVAGHTKLPTAEATAKPGSFKFRGSEKLRTARHPPARPEEFWKDQDEDDTLRCVKSIE